MKRLVTILAICFAAVPLSAQLIRDAKLLSPNHGWVLADNKLLRTDDAGATWRDVSPATTTIDAAYFSDSQQGWVLGWTLADHTQIAVTSTRDGGTTWLMHPLDDAVADLLDQYSGSASISFANASHGWILLRLMSSSNFSIGVLLSTADGGAHWTRLPDPPAAGRIEFNSALRGTIVGGPEGNEVFTTIDGGRTWRSSEQRRAPVSRVPALSRAKLPGHIAHESFADSQRGWVVTQRGICTGFKTNCVQTTTLLSTHDAGATFRDITPPQARGGRRIDAPTAAPQSLMPPQSLDPQQQSAVIFRANRGFDKCDAPTLAQLQDWWTNSPYKDLNLYIGGDMRACKTQANMTPAWIQQVSQMGWAFIPTWVGPQAPCYTGTKGKLSTDPTIAAQQGASEADRAIDVLSQFGIAGTVMYYDMEFYSPPSGDATCIPAVRSFLGAWTQELHTKGALAGAYTNSSIIGRDWVTMQNPPDAIWFARWNKVPSVWDDASFSNSVWPNHQRIHQMYNTDPPNGNGELWGSTLMSIDANVEDAPLATAAVASNVTPETGWWWNPVQTGVGFFLERNASGNIWFVGYLYAPDGRATWVLSAGAMNGSTYNGSLDTFAGGISLTGPYQPHHATGSVGTLTLQFLDSQHATLTWPGGTIPIQRFNFTAPGSPAAPGAMQNGWWWNPDESGRGFGIEVQDGNVFIGSFLYDTNGNPIWYLALGQLKDSLTYVGQWHQFGNGQTLTGPLKPNSEVNPNVGSATFAFTDATHASLTLPDGRVIPLVRFSF